MEYKLEYRHFTKFQPNNVKLNNTSNRLNKISIGPEHRLVDEFLNQGLPSSLHRSIPAILREPKLPTGYPDLVVVFVPTTLSVILTRPINLTSSHFKVLHHIYQSRGISIDTLKDDLAFNRSINKRIVSDLEQCRLIYNQNGVLRAKSLKDIFLARRIVAIEAKISNWHRALSQALANTWFASESYILLPESKNNKLLLLNAKRLGLGVITTNGKNSKIELRSNQNKIPLSYGSWLINEIILKKIAG